MNFFPLENTMYHRDHESEKMRNEYEIQKFWQKLTGVPLKSDNGQTVEKFKDLIDDNRKIMEYCYKSRVTVDEDDHDYDDVDRTSDDTASASSKEPVTEMAEDGRDDGDDGRGEDEDGREDDSNDDDYNDDKDDYYYYDSGGQDNDVTSVRLKREPFSETRLDGKNSLKATIVATEDEEQATDEPPSDLGAVDDRCSLADNDPDTIVSETIVYGKDFSVLLTTGRRSSLVTEKTETSLNNVEALAVARVLEKWINQIDLLDTIDDWNGEGDVIEKQETRSPETLANKIRRLWTLISQTFDLTVRELRASSTFSSLQMANDAMLGSVRNERRMYEERAVNRNALEMLRNKKKRHRQQHKEDKWQMETKRLELAEQFEKAKKLIGREIEYVHQWEDQWAAENREVADEESLALEKEIEQTGQLAAMEDECLNEARRVFNTFIEDFELATRPWDAMVTKQVKIISTDIMNLENKHEELVKILGERREYTDLLQESVDAYATQKQVRDERAWYETCVIRIQAFWRGTMVRRFLGHYKYLRKKRQQKLPSPTKKAAKKPKKKKR